MRKRRTEIEIEIDEIVFVKRLSNASGIDWCAGCAAEGVLVTPEQASLVAGVSVRTINRWVEEGRIHFVETPGVLRVCFNSILKEGLSLCDPNS